jgi:hypothetical protein
MPYDRARHFLGLSEPNWVTWTEQIRRRCGQELLSRGMFPPRRYFSEAAQPFRRSAGCLRSKKSSGLKA